MGETMSGWSAQLPSEWSLLDGCLIEVEFLNLPLRLEGWIEAPQGGKVQEEDPRGQMMQKKLLLQSPLWEIRAT